jgi:hypothetical protein
MYLQYRLLNNEFVKANPTVSKLLASNLLSGTRIDLSTSIAITADHRQNNAIIEPIFNEYLEKTWKDCISELLNIIPVVGSLTGGKKHLILQLVPGQTHQKNLDKAHLKH